MTASLFMETTKIEASGGFDAARLLASGGETADGAAARRAGRYGG